MTLDDNVRLVKTEDKKGCRVYPECIALLDAMAGIVARHAEDKKDCLVYPEGTHHIDAMAHIATAGRIVDVIECWYSDGVISGEGQFGKTADNGTSVDLCEDHDGTWFGIEFDWEDLEWNKK